MSRVHRYDWAGPIVVCKGDEAPPPGAFAARETPEGYLRVEGRINGCGVYQYEDENGETWGELRLKEHVGAPATLESWQCRPITDDHPDVWVDATNITEHRRGTLGSHVVFDGEHTIANPIVIDSPELIAKVREGKTQLSCGYTCVLVEQQGELDGVAYDYIQTEIYGNHVAVVDLARGGPTCSLVFDGAARRRATPDRRRGRAMPKPKTKDKRKSDKRRKKDATLVTSEGEIEIPEDKLAAVMALLADPAETETEAASEGAEVVEGVEGDEGEPTEELVEDEDETVGPAEAAAPKGDSARLAAKLDMLAAENKRLRQGFSAKVDARVALVTKAREIIGSKFSTDGLSDVAIKRAVIESVNPDMKGKLKGKSADYVQGAYEAALDAHAKNSDSSGALMQLAGRVVNSDDGESIDAVYDKMLKDRHDGLEAN